LALAHDHPEKFLKRLVGRTEVEDALLRLGSLTNDERLMTAARNLEITHHVDGNVQAIKVLAGNVDANVKVTKGVARRVDKNLKALRDGTRCLLTILEHVPKFIPVLSRKQRRIPSNVCYFLMVHPSTVRTDTYPQGSSWERKSEHGSPLQILPSIIIMHEKPSTVGLQLGLSKAPRFKNGRKMDLYCGSGAIVSLSGLSLL
jgi:hypothetical protein